MPIADAGNVVGFEHAAAFYVNSNGFSTGTTLPDAISNADVLNSHLMRYVRSVNLPSPARVVTQITGGNRWLGSVMFGIGQVDPFQLILSNIDPTFMALTTGSSVDVALNSEFRRFSANENKGAPPQMGLILSTLYQGRDGLDGVNQWVNYIVPRVQISPALPQMSYQAANDATYTVSATMATKEPHGVPFLQASDGMSLAGDKALMYVIVSEYPLNITTFIGDALATSAKLGYLPATEVVTVNATQNEYAIGGVLTALSAVDSTTGIATFSSAPAAASENGILYGMKYIPDLTVSP